MSTRTPRRWLLDWLVRHLSWYPPYLGAGVRVESDLENNRYRVSMRLRWFNRNTHGTHFGGSLFSMCDPFFALVVQHRLGPAYEVWMKSADIDYVRPGRGTVRAVFHVPTERIEEIRREVDTSGRSEPAFDVNVMGEAGEVVVRVAQVIHVRRRAREDGPRSPESASS